MFDFNIRWNSVISQSQELMKNFTLNLEPGFDKLVEATKLRRKFLSINADSLNQSVLDVIKSHNLSSLSLKECVINKRLLSEALMHMSRLISFTADRVQFDSLTKEIKIEPIQLKLKDLAISFSDMAFFELISTDTLKELSLHSNNERVEIVALFLKKQLQLESLSLTGLCTKNIVKDLTSIDNPFRLKKLEIKKTFVMDEIELLLAIHKDTLLELTIECATNNKFLRFIVTSMSNLKTLTVPRLLISSVNKEDIKLDLRSIKLNTYYLTTTNFDRIFFDPAQNLFPSLEVFDAMSSVVSQDFANTIIDVSRAYPHLKQLNIPSVPGSQFCKNLLSFPNLKELHVSRISEEWFFNDFLERHKKLEKLSIGWVSGAEFSRSNTISVLNICPNLKHISISTDSTLVTRMFSKFKRSHDFPWILETHFKKKRRHETEWIKVVFKFPDDKALFDNKCSVWDDDLIRDFLMAEDYGVNSYVNKFR